MATFIKIQQHIENLHKGVHNFSSDSFVVALTAAANPVLAANSVQGDLTEISYTNCSSRTLAGVTSEHTAGSLPVTATNLVLTASGGPVGPFQYVAIYNNTSAGKELVAAWNHGSEETLADGEQVTLDFTTGNMYTAS